jgi:hypothetical protein
MIASMDFDFRTVDPVDYVEHCLAEVGDTRAELEEVRADLDHVATRATLATIRALAEEDDRAERERIVDLWLMHREQLVVAHERYLARGGPHRGGSGAQGGAQVVGRRVDISLADGWGARTPRTQIVAIGSSDGTDGDALTAAFSRCLAAPAADSSSG